MLELLKQCKYVERSTGERKPCPECVSQKRHRRGYISVACAAGHTWVWCQYCCDCACGNGSGTKQGCQNAMHWFERDSFDTGSRNHMQRHKGEAQNMETKKRSYNSDHFSSKQQKIEDPTLECSKKSDRSRSCNVAESEQTVVLGGATNFLKSHQSNNNVSLAALASYFCPYNDLRASDLSCKRFKVDPSYIGQIQLKDVLQGQLQLQQHSCATKIPAPDCSCSSSSSDSAPLLPPISELQKKDHPMLLPSSNNCPPTLAAIFDMKCSNSSSAAAGLPLLHDIQASSPSTVSSPSSPPPHDDDADYRDDDTCGVMHAARGAAYMPAHLEQQISELDSVGNAAFALVALRRAAGLCTC